MKRKQQQQKNSSRKYFIDICHTKFIKHFDKEITVLMDFSISWLISSWGFSKIAKFSSLKSLFFLLPIKD